MLCLQEEEDRKKEEEAQKLKAEEEAKSKKDAEEAAAKKAAEEAAKKKAADAEAKQQVGHYGRYHHRKDQRCYVSSSSKPHRWNCAGSSSPADSQTVRGQCIETSLSHLYYLSESPEPLLTWCYS